MSDNAQIDDLKASQARLADVVRRLVAVVGAQRAENDALKGRIEALEAERAAAAAVVTVDPAELQAVIDAAHALADEGEAAVPA